MAQDQTGQRSDPTAFGHLRGCGPGAVRQLSRAKKIRGVAGGPGVERRFGFGRLASKEGGDAPAGWFNAACFVGMKTPTAIGVLQGLQERKIFAARATGLELRHGFQRSGHSQSLRHSLHYGTDRSGAGLFFRNFSFFFLNFKLMN